MRDSSVLLLDGGGRDGSAPSDGGGGGDAAAVDGGGGGDSGGRDAGAMMCRGPGDCPRGQRCEGGRCVADPGCCATIRCTPGTTCDPTSCSCTGGTGCCATGGDCGDPTKYCEFETCGCVDIPRCEPACGPLFTCEWGSCVPRCAIEGCPDPTHVCGRETGECTPPLCTADECFSRMPPLRCDPSVGCGDPCTSGDWSWCTMSGGACYLGECVDASCGEARGLPRVDCSFTADCCGTWYCQRAGDPSPPCPFVCPMPPPGGTPMPDPGLCVCGVGGDIIFPGDPDDPGTPTPGGEGGSGGGSGGGGTPGGGPPPPPPGGGIFCIDLRPSSGGGPRPVDPPPRPEPAF